MGFLGDYKIIVTAQSPTDREIVFPKKIANQWIKKGLEFEEVQHDRDYYIGDIFTSISEEYYMFIVNDQSFTKQKKKLSLESLLSKKDDNPLFFEVKGILETPVKEPIASRCTEEFRDGIVFKKEDEIVDSLSICFHCAMIRMTSCKGEVFADKSFYDDYRNILARLGQDVDER